MWSVRSETAWTYGPLSVVADAPSQPAGTSDSVAVARLRARADVEVADLGGGPDAVDPPDQLPGARVDDRVVERLRPLRREHAPAEPVLVAVAEADERRLAALQEPRPPVGTAAGGRRRRRRAARRRGLERTPRADRRRGRPAARRAERAAGDVDQPPVVADRGLQAAVDVRDPAGLLLPAEVRGPVVPGRAGGLPEAGEVRLLQAEGGAVLRDVAERDVGGIARARRREEAVEAGDELRRSGVRVGLDQAARAERVAQLRLGLLDLRRRLRGGRGEVDRGVDRVRRARRGGTAGQQCEGSRQRARESAWRCELRLQDVCSLTDRGAGPWSRVVRAPPRHHTGKWIFAPEAIARATSIRLSSPP